MADDDPLLPEREYWRRQATTLRRTGLSQIRLTAEKWQATIAALLGVIGVVAFVEGPKTLDELERWPEQWILILGVALAAVLAFFAITLAALAAQGVPRHFQQLTAPELARINSAAAGRAASDLMWSRRLAIAAGAILIGGTLLAWGWGLAGDDDEKKTRAIIVTGDGAALCGTLSNQGSEGLALVDDAGATILNLATGVAQVEVVSDCPKAK